MKRGNQQTRSPRNPARLRLEQVEPVVTAIREAADHLPAADKIAVIERLKHISRAQRGQWNVNQTLEHPDAA
jgi:hypothetical protein